ncbi:MAG TPA: hypothetical protein ENK84_03315 [Desulfobulbus sp.]|nr:hypothetical protein [Desulfobulbus sp.]
MTTQAAKDLATYYSGSVEDKLRLARQLYHRNGQRFLQNREITDTLESLRRKAADLDNHMETMGMGARCSACGARVGGGCCSSYMAGNTDAVVLLINLLLGISINPVDNGEECCYLGPRGCIFTIKPIFCLNYNCSHIQQAASKKELKTLGMRSGALLSEQIGLEKLLLQTAEEEGPEFNAEKN